MYCSRGSFPVVACLLVLASLGVLAARLATAGPGGEAARGSLLAPAVGIVVDTADPEGLGRVKVKFPWLRGDEEGAWARLVVSHRAPDAGLFVVPEVDDEVLVAFEHGDPDRPYVLGSVWNPAPR